MDGKPPRRVQHPYLDELAWTIHPRAVLDLDGSGAFVATLTGPTVVEGSCPDLLPVLRLVAVGEVVGRALERRGIAGELMDSYRDALHRLVLAGVLYPECADEPDFEAGSSCTPAAS